MQIRTILDAYKRKLFENNFYFLNQEINQLISKRYYFSQYYNREFDVFYDYNIKSQHFLHKWKKEYYPYIYTSFNMQKYYEMHFPNLSCLCVLGECSYSTKFKSDRYVDFRKKYNDDLQLKKENSAYIFLKEESAEESFRFYINTSPKYDLGNLKTYFLDLGEDCFIQNINDALLELGKRDHLLKLYSNSGLEVTLILNS